MGMFKSAKKVESASAKTKGKTKREVEMDGLSEYAAVDALIKSLEALKETLGADLKGQMSTQFVELGSVLGMKPDSFKGIDDDATASCEIRKRSSRSVLTADETALLDDHTIAYATNQDRPDTFIINEKYATDEVLLGKVEKALAKIVPDDFIQKQDAKVSKVVDDSTVAAVFQKGKGNKKILARLMPLVVTLAVKPRLKNGDVKEAWSLVQDMLTVKNEDESEE